MTVVIIGIVVDVVDVVVFEVFGLTGLLPSATKPNEQAPRPILGSLCLCRHLGPYHRSYTLYHILCTMYHIRILMVLSGLLGPVDHLP